MEVDAIEPAHQFALRPALEAVGVAQLEHASLLRKFVFWKDTRARGPLSTAANVRAGTQRPAPAISSGTRPWK